MDILHSQVSSKLTFLKVYHGDPEKIGAVVVWYSQLSSTLTFANIYFVVAALVEARVYIYILGVCVCALCEYACSRESVCVREREKERVLACVCLRSFVCVRVGSLLMRSGTKNC